MGRRKKYSNNHILLNIIKVILFLFAIIIVFKFAPNYEINDTYAEGKINIIINNKNVTKKLKYDLFIDEDKVIFMSMKDVANYFLTFLYKQLYHLFLIYLLF